MSLFLIRPITSRWHCLSRQLVTECKVKPSSKLSLKSHVMLEYFKQVFGEAVEELNPARLIRREVKLVSDSKLLVSHKTFDINKNIYVVGFGKAVLSMACECERLFGEKLKKGIISVPVKTLETFKDISDLQLHENTVIDVYEGAENNIPDENAEKAADAIISLVESLQENDLLVVLISGGGSSLLPKPKSSISLSEKTEVIKLLSTAGADIQELNTVRKQLSLVKGGGLARLAYPAKIISFIISDVIGSSIEVIASGPTVPNHCRRNAAYEIIQNYELDAKIPKHVLETIKNPENDKSESIPVDEFKMYNHVENFILGSNFSFLNAAKRHSRNFSFGPIILSYEMCGSVHEVAEFYASFSAIICQFLKDNDSLQLIERFKTINTPFPVNKNYLMPLIENKLRRFEHDIFPCILSGGETTAKVSGSGKGGRNQELALIFSKKLYERTLAEPEVFHGLKVQFMSAGTDGIDGPTDAAGAFGSVDVIKLAQENNVNPDEYIANNDSYSFYEKVNNGSFLFKTGHTGTNVMDFHMLLIYRK